MTRLTLLQHPVLWLKASLVKRLINLTHLTRTRANEVTESRQHDYRITEMNMTALRFLTVKEASAAIAAALDIADTDDRAYAARCHKKALEDAIASNAIVYRDPVSRLRISREGIVAALVAHNCVISVADLNVWLDSIGIGVRVAASGDEQVKPADLTTDERPSSESLAKALSPYLRTGRDFDWLRKRLTEAKRYPRLLKYRVFKGTSARWEVGGVVLYLIEEGELTREKAKAALTKYFPRHQYVLDNPSIQGDRSAASFIPSGI
ncbi:hypothetical protein LJ656_27395 [Paraburkholderia sp. MMS20-SJTR3]|uniref:Uncharacterized protein n=1 Tax=Paraburkholderia sejongensis TaxID=2886946 RepID=A0ABS8K2D5_9BURK|nr:hypothetical protein [Paraburkholderia sp. MMS20-SJTR3]MCC8396320.1 hypothetical protein [Paraburkholderia sp. MMS20-SJTR3]